MRWLFGNVERLHSSALFNAGIIPKSIVAFTLKRLSTGVRIGNTIPSIHFPA
ncbi:MAG TPA: hypothetical protein VIX38_04765 [Nitrososphaeraceae archaeon]